MEMTAPDVEEVEKASFDLTDFGSDQVWNDLRGRHELEQNRDYSGRGWEWISVDGDLVVHTYNNPVTGEMADTPERENEPGYASYIHVKGSPEKVEAFYEDAREVASYVKGSDLGEWIV